MSATFQTTVLVLLLLVATASHAKIYKWVDEHGKVHFSDRQDHSVKQEVVNVKPRASKWSRFDIRIETVDLELTAEENPFGTGAKDLLY